DYALPGVAHANKGILSTRPRRGPTATVRKVRRNASSGSFSGGSASRGPPRCDSRVGEPLARASLLALLLVARGPVPRRTACSADGFGIQPTKLAGLVRSPIDWIVVAVPLEADDAGPTDLELQLASDAPPDGHHFQFPKGTPSRQSGRINVGAAET